jgi:hypothetical protein
MTIRSALYYPHTDVRSEAIMKSALLTWDKLHTIVPRPEHAPHFDRNKAMARAWEMIGDQVVPQKDEKDIAHASIVDLLEQGVPNELRYLKERDVGEHLYEIYPEKLALDTWVYMQSKEVTPSKLANGDYPFSQEGGLIIMSKLAEAVAGDRFARVTDRAMAFGLTPERAAYDPATQATLVTLDIVDESTISLTEAIEFRERERNEGDGSATRRLRHRYADSVAAHLVELKQLPTQRLRDDKVESFRADMEDDLKEMADALRRNRIELVLKPVIVSTIVASIAAVAGAATVPALIVGGTAALGASSTEIADKLSKLFEAGFGFSRKQRDLMEKHPMAYMYQLAQA